MVVTHDATAIVRRQVEGVEFGFYTDEDVRSRSVVEITSPLAFDPLSNNPLPGGLLDPRMGPVDTYGSDPPCATCALKRDLCPGHFGHIELAVPVHHPLLNNEILNILRCKCLVCHKLRGAPRQLAVVRAKFNLLYQGRLEKVYSLDDDMQVALRAKGHGTSDESRMRKIRKSIGEVARVLDEFLRQYQPDNAVTTGQDANSSVAFGTSPLKRRNKLNSFERQLRTDLIKECVSLCKSAKRCAHCGAFSPKIRQDSSNKFFRGHLAARNKELNKVDGLAIRSALEEELEEKDTTAGAKGESGGGYQSDDDMDAPQNDEEMDEDGDDAVPMNDDSDAEDQDKDEEGKAAAAKDDFMHTKEVQAQLKRTWKTDPYLLNCLFGSGASHNPNGYQFYFMQAVPVPPNRFRPLMSVGAMQVEHAQNMLLSKVIQRNELVRNLFSEGDEPRAYTAWIDLQTQLNCFMDASKDPSQTPQNQLPPGIRQILEKKEGLFRKNMMGKRVDFACRSVISPDPYVGANEIGLPLYFATILTYPTPVTQLNIKEMRTLVERGPANYPGARWVETYLGGRPQRIDLSKMKPQSRAAVAAMLLTNLKKSGGRPTIVGRQLRDGDYVLMNRQPTLHKPGIMAHRVRVLHNPTQKTIRMHYANCNTYNADFDGDEMNCHYPQNDIARAEAYYVARTDLQYIVPTDGSPLRGLIQDHVVGGVMLTKKDTFLQKWEYQQLLFACLSSLPGLEVIRSDAAIELVPPAIMKPRELWTGKQVITTLLLHLRKGSDRDSAWMSDLPGISMQNKSKTPPAAFGAEQEEHLVLILEGELLRGVLDKNSFGASHFSLVHSVYEAYGPEKAGLLLNAFSRLFTAYVQYFAAHSCRTEDLMLTKKAGEERKTLIQKAYNLGTRAAKAWADSEGGKVKIPPIEDTPETSKPMKPFEIAAASAKIGELLSGADGADNFAALDGYMQGQLNPLSSAIVKKALPDGLVVPFPFNTFGVMTTTGAKGSIVNQSQVICSLGQQALEGRRVPRLSSGRTLPSFAPYDPNPRADGFVMDRFLTGIRPQEYYFHCMAGREGLVDTAVKTSRSGYLQRCLVKHLEELKICYDFTVRNAEGGVVQFLYGEDGIDPTRASYLDCTEKSLLFYAQNYGSLSRRNLALPSSTIDLSAADAVRHDSVVRNLDNLLRPGARVRARKLREGSVWKRGVLCRGWFDAIVTEVHRGGTRLDLEYLNDGGRVKNVPIEVDFGPSPITRSVKSLTTVATMVEPVAFDPVLSSNERGHLVGSSGACLSERVAQFSYEQIKNSPMLREEMAKTGVSPEQLGALVAAKYSSSLCAPGEAVGCIAAQSIGEPSTQMTLNTFHLAGSAANLTLGIPRLREIIMSASTELKTPTMSVPLHASVTDKEAVRLTRKFTKLTLFELISGDQGVAITEKLEKDVGGDWNRVYLVQLKFHPAERIREAFGLSIHDIAAIVSRSYVPLLSKLMKKELKRSAADGDVRLTEVLGGKKQEYIKPGGNDDDEGGETTPRGRGADHLGDKDDDDDDDDVGEQDGADVDKQKGRKQSISYDDDSDEEKDDEEPDQGGGGQEGAFDDSDGEQEDSSPQKGAQTPSKKKSKDVLDGEQLRVVSKSNSIILQPLRVDPSVRPLLMVGLVEQAARKTVVRQREKIDQAFVNDEDNGRGRCLQTAGVNFEELWKLDCVDHDRLLSNDIWALRNTYGVEAAQISVGKQISGVFGVYGIEVDPRHLSLIGDYMTFEGGFKPMSRNGMKQASSAFLQMSFETTANFMREAAISRDVDTMESPSANICVGRPIRHGTGAMECLAAQQLIL